jgi:hypothetical protein
MAEKRVDPPLDAMEADSVFRKLTGLCQLYSTVDFRGYPTILPDNFLQPMLFDGSPESCDRVARAVAAVVRLDERVVTRFVNREAADEQGALSDTWQEGRWEEHGAAGVYYCPGSEDADDPPTVLIDLARFVGAPPGSLVTILAHEYSHHLIREHAGIDTADEHLADLLPVLYGFGIFSANSAFSYETRGEQAGIMAWHGWSVRKLGYLSGEEFAFALAVTSTWKRESARQIARHLGDSVAPSFRKATAFLESERLAIWDMAPRKGARGELGSVLAAAAVRSAGETRPEPPPPKVRHVDIKWAGTFIGITSAVEVEGCTWYVPEALDFGEETDTITADPGTVFGIAYRLSSEERGYPFPVEERVYRVRPGRSGSADGTVAVAHVTLPAGELKHFVMPVDDPRFAESGTWALEVWHEGELRHRRLFTLRR